MAFTRKAYEDGDFVRIRDFLKYSLFKDPSLKNWLIDRWNFGRYFSQTMHGTLIPGLKPLGSGKMKMVRSLQLSIPRAL